MGGGEVTQMLERNVTICPTEQTSDGKLASNSLRIVSRIELALS